MHDTEALTETQEGRSRGIQVEQKSVRRRGRLALACSIYLRHAQTRRRQARA